MEKGVGKGRVIEAPSLIYLYRRMAPSFHAFDPPPSCPKSPLTVPPHVHLSRHRIPLSSSQLPPRRPRSFFPTRRRADLPSAAPTRPGALEARKGARVVRLMSVRRNVRTYESDLVKNGSLWGYSGELKSTDYASFVAVRCLRATPSPLLFPSPHISSPNLADPPPQPR